MKAGRMLAVNPNAIREENDYYATDPYVINRSIDFFYEVGITKQSPIWECSCGEGHLSKRLIELGFENVISSDLIDRGYGQKQDFLKTANCKHPITILTNPPFKLASEFIFHANAIQSDGEISLFFLKIQFLETEKRIDLFKQCGLKYVGVMSNRACCAMNGDFDKYFKQDKKTGTYKGGTQLMSWFVFQKGYIGEPVIKFIK